MAALTAPGIGSNLDVNGLVSQLMAVEKQPLTIMQKTEATVQAQISAYGQLQSQIALFGDTAAALGKATTMAAFKATVGDTEVASVSAATKSVAGSYAFEVTQLAKNEKLATTAVASSSTVVGTGSLTITLGTYASGPNTFTARSDKTPLSLTIDASNNTLAGVRDAINAAQGGASGVRASIVTDTTGARLVISSTDTGAQNSIKIDAPGLPAFAFDPRVAGVQPVTELQPAQDAKIKLDNLEIASASNTVTGAVDGLTLNLLKAKPGVPTTLTVSADLDTAKTALRSFVASYNALNTLVRGFTKYDASTKTQGALQGEVTAVSVLNQMRSAVTGAIPGGSTDLKTLSEIGISIQLDGSLKLDETKLGNVTSTAAGYASMARLFVAGTDNPDTFVTRIKTFVDKTQGTGGMIPSKTDGLGKTVKQLEKQQSDFNDRMVGVEARLRAQFNALDANLTSQNAVTAYLTQQQTAWTNAAKQ